MRLLISFIVLLAVAGGIIAADDRPSLLVRRTSDGKYLRTIVRAGDKIPAGTETAPLRTLAENDYVPLSTAEQRDERRHAALTLLRAAKGNIKALSPEQKDELLAALVELELQRVDGPDD